MKIKGLVDEDFINYKMPCMFIICPHCSFKCNMYAGYQCCQNVKLKSEPDIEIGIKDLVERYLSNNITKAVVFGGLEPFDSWQDLLDFLKEFRKHTDDDVVIYTGYEKNMLEWQLGKLEQFENIVVKFGHYIPNVNTVYSDVLGITLASENQFAERIS